MNTDQTANYISDLIVDDLYAEFEVAKARADAAQDDTTLCIATRERFYADAESAYERYENAAARNNGLDWEFIQLKG